MDWITDSGEGVALLVGLVAFFGGLMGALLGFVSNYINTSRQIDRQERDVRRGVYGEYLAAALALEHFHSRHEHVHQLAQASQLSLEGQRREMERTTGIGRREEIQKVIDLIESQAKEHWAEFDKLHDEFSVRLRDFMWMTHRLKIVAPTLIHQVAMRLYDDLRKMVFAEKPEDRRSALDHFNKTLVVFTDLARADTKAPGAASWQVLSQKYEPQFNFPTTASEIEAAELAREEARSSGP